MHADLQISLHEIGLPFSSSGGAMIHRLCTDYLILASVLLQDRAEAKVALSLTSAVGRDFSSSLLIFTFLPVVTYIARLGGCLVPSGRAEFAS